MAKNNATMRTTIIRAGAGGRLRWQADSYDAGRLSKHPNVPPRPSAISFFFRPDGATPSPALIARNITDVVLIGCAIIGETRLVVALLDDLN